MKPARKRIKYINLSPEPQNHYELSSYSMKLRQWSVLSFLTVISLYHHIAVDEKLKDSLRTKNLKPY